MILLDSPSKSLELALAVAITTNSLPYFCEYATTSKSGDPVVLASNNGSLTSATVVACPAPTGTVQIQQIKSLSAYNADTVAATVSVQVNNNGTRYTRYKVTLQPGDNLFYMIERGFYVVDSSGNVRGIVPLPLGAATDAALATLHSDLVGGLTGQTATLAADLLLNAQESTLQQLLVLVLMEIRQHRRAFQDWSGMPQPRLDTTLTTIS